MVWERTPDDIARDAEAQGFLANLAFTDITSDVNSAYLRDAQLTAMNMNLNSDLVYQMFWDLRAAGFAENENSFDLFQQSFVNATQQNIAYLLAAYEKATEDTNKQAAGGAGAGGGNNDATRKDTDGKKDDGNGFIDKVIDTVTGNIFKILLDFSGLASILTEWASTALVDLLKIPAEAFFDMLLKVFFRPVDEVIRKR